MACISLVPSTTSAPLTRVWVMSGPRPRRPWLQGSPIIVGRSGNSSRCTCRRLGGYHPSSGGVPRMRSNASRSGGAGTTVRCGATDPTMRTLKLHFPDEALPTLDTYLKQTKEARVFRRAQAVREVVKGQRFQTVSDALHFTYSALRKWVHRFAHQGIQGLVDRPRPGRPPKVTCALAQHLDRLVDEDPLQHGSVHSQWSCQALATVLARQTGVQVSRESVRAVLKKRR